MNSRNGQICRRLEEDRLAGARTGARRLRSLQRGIFETVSKTAAGSERSSNTTARPFMTAEGSNVDSS